MKNSQRSWLYPTCDFSSQAVRICIALATFSLKSSDSCTSFILVFAMNSSGWAGSSWIPVVALATAASPRKVQCVGVQHKQSGGGRAALAAWADCKAVQCLSHRPGTLPVPLPYPHCQVPESKVKGLHVLGHCSWSHGAAVRPFPWGRGQQFVPACWASGTRGALVRVHLSASSEGKCEFRACAYTWGWASLSC